MDRFGLEEQQAGWRVKGALSLDQCLDLSKKLIAFVGMTPDGLPTVDNYPKGGKGGQGVQVYQPLFESWLMISTWPAHGFVRINLSSCKPFDAHNVGEFLQAQIGEIDRQWWGSL